MSKYQTEAGIECTPEEDKLIDSLKRLAKKWEKNGKRLLAVFSQWFTSCNDAWRYRL